MEGVVVGRVLGVSRFWRGWSVRLVWFGVGMGRFYGGFVFFDFEKI